MLTSLKSLCWWFVHRSNALCYFIKPAAKLLGVLLYRYSIRQEHQQDAENINEVAAAQGKEGTQDTSFYIYRRQSQLVADMVDEMTEKTLHDVAIPTLQLLGYLDVDETPIIHKYDLHVNIVREALAAYKKNPVELFEFLLGHLQLEKFLIDEKLEEVLINKKKFSLALEKVLIANRKSSNNKRGRKTRQERALLANSGDPQISLEIDSEIGNKEERVASPHVDATAHAFNETSYHIASAAIGNDAEEDAPTVKMPAIKLNGANTHADSVVHPDLPNGSDRGDTPGIRGSVPDRPVEHTPGTPALPSATEPPSSVATVQSGVLRPFLLVRRRTPPLRREATSTMTRRLLLTRVSRARRTRAPSLRSRFSKH